MDLNAKEKAEERVEKYLKQQVIGLFEQESHKLNRAIQCAIVDTQGKINELTDLENEGLSTSHRIDYYNEVLTHLNKM